MSACSGERIHSNLHNTSYPAKQCAMLRCCNSACHQETEYPRR